MILGFHGPTDDRPMMEAGTQLVNCVLKFGDSDGKTIGETHPTLVPAL